jgi:hypothetical protein
VSAFKGEDAFTSAIIAVTRGTAPTVWFTSGHGEKTVDDPEPQGLSDLRDALTQQDVAVETVTLLERAEIPAEAKLVVIAGPTRRFTNQEIDLLQAYLTRGGKVLALLDPLDESGLAEWLGGWGILIGDDIVVDPARQLPFVSAANLFVTEYAPHPLVEKMKTLATLFPLARSVKPEGVVVTPLALTSPGGWGETQTSAQPFEFTEGQDLKGPASIAAAAERTIPAQGETPAAVARMVVIGDSDFATNAQLPNVGNRDFGSQLTGVFWFSFLALPLALGALGALMWWTRRTCALLGARHELEDDPALAASHHRRRPLRLADRAEAADARRAGAARSAGRGAPA